MGRVIVAGGNPGMKVPVTGIQADTLAVGTVVKLMEGGTAVDYLVVNQGKPSNSSLYDDSCDGTWLLRKDIHEDRQWDSDDSNDYANSTIHTYLNSTFYDLFDAGAKAAIRQVKIPYVNGTGSGGSVASGANGLSAKVFLLGGYEAGFTQSDLSSLLADGAKLAYFDAGTGADANNKRVAYLNGEAKNWWLRTQNTSYTGYAWVIYNGGNYFYSSYSTSLGVRPCVVVPKTAIFDEATLILKGVS